MKYWKRARLAPGMIAAIVLIGAATDFDQPSQGDAGSLADAVKGSKASIVTYAGQNIGSTDLNMADMGYHKVTVIGSAGLHLEAVGQSVAQQPDLTAAGGGAEGESGGKLALAARGADPLDKLITENPDSGRRAAGRDSIKTLGLEDMASADGGEGFGGDAQGNTAPADAGNTPEDNQEGDNQDTDHPGAGNLDPDNPGEGNLDQGDPDGNPPDAEAAGEEGLDGEDGQEEGPAPQFYSLGVSHSTVADIQQRLMDLGYMDYAEPTKYYGSITEHAVKLFQRQNDLNQDGIIGPLTMEMLFAEDANYYLAKLGMSGDDIKRIQQRLYEMGYLAKEENVTGYFGDLTEAAVKEMQNNNGLAADGKVGQMTLEMLYSEDAKANIMSFGDKSDIVKGFQERLKELGYLTTTPDGLYGNDTVAAVKLFQSRNDLVVDGYLGPSTLVALSSQAAVPNGLILGDSGDTVKRVQELLSKYGYLSSSNCTGYFGEITEQAVKNFQKNNGLSVDGNVGMKTMAKLTSKDAKKAGSSTGSTGSSGTGSTGSSSNTSSSGNNGNSSGSTSTSASVSSLLAVAKSKLGCPYVLGAKGPNSFDCSGYVYWCLNQIGIKQSYVTSYGWRTIGKYQKITSFSSIKAGDIVVVKGHVGIAAGNGMVYDASSSSGKIVYRSLGAWWKNNFIVAWRIF